ncbi:MAG: tripartite tricarboxylate transporter substrate binding protein, partial [Mesorhizobium sp.]
MLNRRRFLTSTAAGFAALHFTPAFAQDAPQLQI